MSQSALERTVSRLSNTCPRDYAFYWGGAGSAVGSTQEPTSEDENLRGSNPTASSLVDRSECL
jgi:hypothetical protein